MDISIKRSNTTDQTLFPWKLHNLLEDAEAKGFDRIVAWLPCGTMFKIHFSQVFESKILANYFNHNHLPSFQKQLKLYDFQRVRQGPNKGGYFHQLFIRGKPDLCHSMDRVKMIRRGRKKAPSSRNGAVAIKEPQQKFIATSHSEDYEVTNKFKKVTVRLRQKRKKVEINHTEIGLTMEKAAKETSTMVLASDVLQFTESGSTLSIPVNDLLRARDSQASPNETGTPSSAATTQKDSLSFPFEGTQRANPFAGATRNEIKEERCWKACQASRLEGLGVGFPIPCCEEPIQVDRAEPSTRIDPSDADYIISLLGAPARTSPI